MAAASWHASARAAQPCSASSSAVARVKVLYWTVSVVELQAAEIQFTWRS
jgi:hypothetical protein